MRSSIEITLIISKLKKTTRVQTFPNDNFYSSHAPKMQNVDKINRTKKNRSEGFPARDIWFLHTVPQGPYQMGRVVGTPPSPPPPSPSVGVTGGLSPPGPPPLLDWQGTSPGPNGLGAQAFQAHGLEMGRKSTGSNHMVLNWAGSPQVPTLQYFQIHRSYQNAWSFSIPRFTGHTRMLGPSVFADSQVIPECLVL